MTPSLLSAILLRLDIIIYDNCDVGIPRFEKVIVDGCVVKYNRYTESFELEEHDSNQTYQFDDLDLVAIEIYELLQD